MKEVVDLLLDWYSKEKRNLPWRKDKNPYHIWISEIMLQQTRIETVIDYYQTFLEKIPTVQDLSEISEDELLKLWEGLGYYSRARNLKKAAIKIVNDFDGIFPNHYLDILSLPGIGEYTAGAIASICFQLPEVAIDGNVMRVYARVENLDIDTRDLKKRKEVGEEIKKILPKESGNFNQAMMELGEVICLPNGMPKCFQCPLREKCKAHLKNSVSYIPRKSIGKSKRKEEYTLFLIKYKNKYAIQKRSSGLLKNMWEFPNELGFLSFLEVKEIFSDSIYLEKGISNIFHFTHKKWFIHSYKIEVKKKLSQYTWASLDDIVKRYAIPTAFMPFVEDLKRDKEMEKCL